MLPAFIAVGQSRFIAVMPVGDDELLFAHLAANQSDDSRVRNTPYPVLDGVLIAHLHERRVCRCERILNLRRGIAIEHENLSDMGTSGPQQIEPVSLGLSQGLLVPEHHP